MKTIEDLSGILHANEGVVIIKFGATWCAPCRSIEQGLVQAFSKMPKNVKCYMIDVDECPELYSYFKTKKMVNGIPALLSFVRGNTSYIPDYSVIGADIPKIQHFLQRCLISAAVV